jgi:uncharacterized membrane protein YphA (DoxX/SURF4 family)
MHSKEIGPLLLRISLSLVFLYFAVVQLKDPGSWNTYVPNFLHVSGISANNVVIINGFIELTLGLFLISGLYTRFASLLLSLHLFGIAFFIGFNPLGIRDFGLSLATLAIFFNGCDRFTLDYKFSKKTN